VTASETPPAPDGYVLMRWNTLAAILGRHAALDPAAEPPPVPGPAEPPTQPEAAATWPGLSAAVGLLTGRLGGHTIDCAGLAGDVAAGEVIAALVTVAAATLREWLPDAHAGALLRNLGLIAATGGANLNGDSNGIR
jgi:hypothetical protein